MPKLSSEKDEVETKSPEKSMIVVELLTLIETAGHRVVYLRNDET